MTTRQRNTIKKFLTAQDKKQLAKEFSIRYEAVRLKLNGKRRMNDEFTLRAIHLAEKRKRAEEALENKIKKLAA